YSVLVSGYHFFFNFLAYSEALNVTSHRRKDHIFMNLLRPETFLNTMPCQLEHGLSPQKLILRNTMNYLLMVIHLILDCSSIISNGITRDSMSVTHFVY